MTSNFEVTSPQKTLSEEIAHHTNEHQPFEERLEAALEDTNMHQALERFAPSWRISRSNVFASEEDDYGSEFSFASMRSELRKAKDYAIRAPGRIDSSIQDTGRSCRAMIYEARTTEDEPLYL